MLKWNGAVAPFVKVMPMKVLSLARHAVLAALAASLLSSCAAIDRIKNIGQAPPLTAVDNPTTRPGYKPVQMPMPAAQPASYNPNSLWRNGSRAFFKDQRAHQIGDILTVQVNITDKANLSNETQRTRTTTEDSGITDFFGKNKVPIVNAAVPTAFLRRIQTRPPTAKAPSTAQKRCRPTLPRWSPRCCRTATWWSRASKRSASISRCAN